MSETHRVRVFITVDTEYSVGGAFADPANRTPVGNRAVELPSHNSSQGLGFLLNTLDAHGLPATFFVETCNTAYFGDEPITQVIHAIDAAGHDNQLHLHPCWSAFSDPEWQTKVTQRNPDDSLMNYPVSDIVGFIRDGIRIFENAGVPAPIALRAGNLHAGNNVYEAMMQTGIQIGSNIGIGLFAPSNPQHHRYGGCFSIGDTFEIPVLSYKELGIGKFFRIKTATVIGSTFAELKHLLKVAYKCKLQNFVILTHPSEFAEYTQPSVQDITANRRTQTRLKKLCRFLSKNPERYDVTTFARLHESGLAPCDDPVLKAPLRFTAQRLTGRILRP